MICLIILVAQETTLEPLLSEMSSFEELKGRQVKASYILDCFLILYPCILYPCILYPCVPYIPVSYILISYILVSLSYKLDCFLI